MSEEKEENITIWNLKIPINKELREHIDNEFYLAVRETLENDESIMKSIRLGIFNHKQYYKKLFRELIIEIIDEMDLEVKFNV